MKEEIGYITLSRELMKAKDGYTAICEELQLTTCGATFEEAERRLSRAMTMLLDTATKRGELESLLKERGIPFFSAKGARILSSCNANVKPGQWISIETRELALA
ncbi:MAG: hypothetical protein Q7T04_06475 [Dehalococcoidia bacterium]|nr:hypothetical protein [Dehalococcoidia bacterium]